MNRFCAEIDVDQTSEKLPEHPFQLLCEVSLCPELRADELEMFLGRANLLEQVTDAVR